MRQQSHEAILNCQKDMLRNQQDISKYSAEQDTLTNRLKELELQENRNKLKNMQDTVLTKEEVTITIID